MNGRLLISIFILCTAWEAQSAPGRSEPVPDIRIAIDVSGSMKKNDPKQLRSPALKLLVGLMPDGMYSGVWTFGQYVNMQVKYGKVTPKWRALARKEADKIHSRALFTNIEEAIQRASYNWKKPDKRFNRNLILLTDGKVDIARDQEVNQASRARILEHWLPRMKKAGVRIHTVALSADVDRELLSVLSDQTGGWYEQVDNAEALQRIFLRLFEKSAPRDSLPIKGNRFHVDSEVKDMTLLIFHKPGARKLNINTPKSGRWNENNAPGHVTWFNEEGYDLITIKNPEAGDWILETENDPDNRVMIVTNMKLKTNRLPDHILAGENLDLEASLQDMDTTVKRKDFLKLVQFSALDQKTGEVGSTSYSLQDLGDVPDRKKHDGIFSQRLNTKLTEGLHTLIVRADGATFQREIRHTFQLHPGIANVSIIPQEEGYQLRLSSNDRLIDPQSVQLSLKPDELNHAHWQQDKNVQIIMLPANMKGKPITLELTAKRRNGSELHTRYTRMVDAVASTVHTSKEAADQHPGDHNNTKHKQEVTAHTDNDDEHKGNHHDVHKEENKAPTNWVLITWLIILINLIVLITGILGWMFYKKRKAANESSLDAEMEI